MINSQDTAIIRVEQLAPFPYDRIKETLENYKNASEIVWVQEEHGNGGAWSFVKQRFDVVTSSKLNAHLSLIPVCYKKILNELGRSSVKYVGRKPSGSTAAGKNLHVFERPSNAFFHF